MKTAIDPFVADAVGASLGRPGRGSCVLFDHACEHGCGLLSAQQAQSRWLLMFHRVPDSQYLYCLSFQVRIAPSGLGLAEGLADAVLPSFGPGQRQPGAGGSLLAQQGGGRPAFSWLVLYCQAFHCQGRNIDGGPVGH